MASAGGPARKGANRSEFQPRKKRGHHRRPVVYAGVLERSGLQVRCVIVDISAKGAKVRTLEPYVGAFRNCTLTIAGAGRIEADVAWRRGNELGLEFHEPTALAPGLSTSSVTEILTMLNRR